MTTEQLINKTKELITIPSTADNPAALRQAVDFIADMVKDVPEVTIEWFEQNGKPSFLAYRGKVRPATFDIILNAHVDVVPGPAELFEPRIEEGKLYGRGALDMKGTAVVLASLFSELVNEVPYALGLQVVSDEEVGGYDGVRLQINEGVRGKFIIMGEYANEPNVIYNAARGLCWTEIAFKGRSAHGGHLWHGSNAVVKAATFAASVLNRYPTPDKETWTTTASIANLSTPNQTYNKVPDEAVLKIDFRFTQEDPVFENRENLEAFITSIDPEAELVNVEVFEPAVKVEQLNPYVQALSAAVQATTNTKPQYQWRPGGSDGRHYALVQNDTIEFGLYGKHSHSDGEFVSIASFAEYRATMRHFLQQPLSTTVNNQEPMTAPRESLQLSLLRKLVGMRTVAGDKTANNKALSFVEDFLHTRGMHITHYEHEGYRSILATTRPDTKEPTVLLLGHIDVVPAAPEQYDLRVADGRIYGRGVIDMKFALAGYLQVVDMLQNDLGAYDFGILITTDEEMGGYNGAKAVAEGGLRPKVVINPDGGENWNIETFAKGVQWIKIEATGKSSHASRPWEGSNAISNLITVLDQVKQLVPETSSREGTSLSIGTIEGGTTGNQIPDHAAALLDIRYGSIEEYKTLLPRIQEICTVHGVQASVLVNDPPCINDPDNHFISAFRDVVRGITHKTPGTCRSYGTTDCRFFSPFNIPCVITTPEAGGRHTDNEWISEEGFEQFGRILHEYIQRIALPTPVAHVLTSHSEEQSLPDKNQTHVWFAMYGSGLSKENFLCYLQGGRPKGAVVTYPGCTDKTLPLADSFMSIPYSLYFAGESPVWGGGYVSIQPKPDKRAHTIARAYLITVGQLEEIIAQHNGRTAILPAPLAKAIQHGHATIGDGSGDYDELVYCGEKDGYPMFAITATVPRFPYVPPSLVYTRLVCKGLSEAADITPQKAIQYVLATPGIAGHYQQEDLATLFNEISVEAAEENAQTTAPMQKQ